MVGQKLVSCECVQCGANLTRTIANAPRAKCDWCRKQLKKESDHAYYRKVMASAVKAQERRDRHRKLYYKNRSNKLGLSV